MNFAPLSASSTKQMTVNCVYHSKWESTTNRNLSFTMTIEDNIKPTINMQSISFFLKLSFISIDHDFQNSSQFYIQLRLFSLSHSLSCSLLDENSLLFAICFSLVWHSERSADACLFQLLQVKIIIIFLDVIHSSQNVQISMNLYALFILH